jgi:RNA polymerase sigma factor (TIGR02999 family)
LSRIREGDEVALRLLFDAVYDDLRRRARQQLRRNPASPTLNTTALVHEAFIKLASGSSSFEDRSHFYHAAARAMRQILIDNARRRRAAKRGGGAAPFSLDAGQVAIEDHAEELLALDEALQRLAREDPRLVRVVELRFFAGLSVEETGAALDVSERTVKRGWRLARAFLYRELAPQQR